MHNRIKEPPGIDCRGRLTSCQWGRRASVRRRLEEMSRKKTSNEGRLICIKELGFEHAKKCVPTQRGEWGAREDLFLQSKRKSRGERVDQNARPTKIVPRPWGEGNL